MSGKGDDVKVDTYPELLAPLTLEFIGTFFLSLTIAMSAGSPLAPASIGWVLTACVYMGAKISGSHFNPAVSLAVALCGKMSWVNAGFYVLVQFVAAFAAGIVAAIVARGQGFTPGYPAVTPDEQLPALICETLVTFLLVLVVLCTAASTKREGNGFFGLAIGLTVFAGNVSVGGISGGAFNPAVGTGLTFMQGSFVDFWVYWTGPTIGAFLGCVAFWLMNGDEFQDAKFWPQIPESLKGCAPYLMEGIGTFYLTFVCSMTTESLLGPLAIGSMAIALIYMAGKTSGSHFNPAITVAAFSSNLLSIRDAGWYVLSQLSGSVLAAAFCRMILGWRMGYPHIQEGLASIPAALLIEMLLTFLIVLTYLNTMMKKKETENFYYAIALGGAIFAGTTIAQDISGGAFNPLIGTFLPFFAGDFTMFWLYWIAPVVGGLAAAGVYSITSPFSEEFDELKENV